MVNSIGNAFLDSALDWLNAKVLGIAAWLIGLIDQYIITFFDHNVIKSFLDFSSWINILVFGVTFIVVLVDIAEEKISEKPVYFGVAFTNIIKAFAFAVFARWIAVWSMELANSITTIFGITISADSFSLHASSIISLIPGTDNVTIIAHLLLMMITIIAVLFFMVMSLRRFGTMFIHIFTSMLYIPDIMRGDTTKMGDWLRQMIAIVLTYTFIHLLFFLGCGFFIADDLLLCLLFWLSMPLVSRVLNKFGWSSGSQGSFGAMAIQTGAIMIR